MCNRYIIHYGRLLLPNCSSDHLVSQFSSINSHVYMNCYLQFSFPPYSNMYPFAHTIRWVADGYYHLALHFSNLPRYHRHSNCNFFNSSKENIAICHGHYHQRPIIFFRNPNFSPRSENTIGFIYLILLFLIFTHPSPQ